MFQSSMSSVLPLLGGSRRRGLAAGFLVSRAWEKLVTLDKYTRLLMFVLRCLVTLSKDNKEI